MTPKKRPANHQGGVGGLYFFYWNTVNRSRHLPDKRRVFLDGIAHDNDIGTGLAIAIGLLGVADSTPDY